jgi:N-glycosylase/DNA lyase
LLRVDLNDLQSIDPIDIQDELPIGDRGLQVELVVASSNLILHWGQPHHLGSCAYWMAQARSFMPYRSHAFGDNLREEVAACLLGGYGMPAELGLSAFWRLRDGGILHRRQDPDTGELQRILTEPLRLPGGRLARYRFPRQRAARLAVALKALRQEEPPMSPVALRDWLLAIPGIGPKTASWIVRNRTGSSAVAIIDVHILRAGTSAGFFRTDWRIPRDYSLFERAFLGVARLGGVSSATLDACIWNQLHGLGRAWPCLLGPLDPPGRHKEA